MKPTNFQWALSALGYSAKGSTLRRALVDALRHAKRQAEATKMVPYHVQSTIYSAWQIGVISDATAAALRFWVAQRLVGFKIVGAP